MNSFLITNKPEICNSYSLFVDAYSDSWEVRTMLNEKTVNVKEFTDIVHTERKVKDFLDLICS
jgi:hypothetical protein